MFDFVISLASLLGPEVLAVLSSRLTTVFDI